MSYRRILRAWLVVVLCALAALLLVALTHAAHGPLPPTTFLP